MKASHQVSSRLRYAAERCSVESPSAFTSARPSRAAFTLIELLTVISIMGILAALLVPVLKHFAKPDATLAATRQMLDDCSRARALAISQRSTVYMVFIPTNFWVDPFNGGFGPGGSWNRLQMYGPDYRQATVVTQLYAAQWNGYMMVSLRSTGDQPGRSFPRDVVRVRTLPDSAFIAPFKFTAPLFGGAPLYPTNRQDLPIYGFPKTNNIPFPTTDVFTNAALVNDLVSGRLNFVTLPYIAFNYLGQLTPGDGTLLPYDENIPLSYGTIAQFHNATTKAAIQGLPVANEIPPGNSTNISYNIIHIDRLTGRARLERQEVL